MNGTTLVYALLAAGAGACIALQASANGKFRQNLVPPADASGLRRPGVGVVLQHLRHHRLCAWLAMPILRPPLPDQRGAPTHPVVELDRRAARRRHRAGRGDAAPRLGAAAFIALVVGRATALLAAARPLRADGPAGARDHAGKVLGAVLVVGGVVCIKFL